MILKLILHIKRKFDKHFIKPNGYERVMTDKLFYSKPVYEFVDFDNYSEARGQW